MNVPIELMVSISGVRGFSPSVLSPEIAYAFAYCYVSDCPDGPIVVSRDSRKSGHVLKGAIMQALADLGREILDADLVPLPSTQMAIEHYGAAGGIDVTASHNPAEYNGLKFLNSEGTFLIQEDVDRLLLRLKDFQKPSSSLKISVRDIQEEVIKLHLSAVGALVKPGKTLRVAVDAVNGAGSYIVPRFLQSIGCEVLPIAIDPEQDFPHVPEPLPANLSWTQKELENKQYDLCVVVDPDADRLVLIDEKGSLIWEEATIPLVAQELLESGKRGRIILNMSTSSMTEELASKYGVTVERSAVGERNVVSKMQESGAFFGAEGSGGIINSDVHYGRDALVGIAHIISLLRRTSKPLSQLVDELPKRVMRKAKVPIGETGNKEEIYRQLLRRFPDAKVDRTDGLHLSWNDKWIHLRPSNTEPIFRIIAEASTESEVEKLLDLDLFS